MLSISTVLQRWDIGFFFPFFAASAKNVLTKWFKKERVFKGHAAHITFSKADIPLKLFSAKLWNENPPSVQKQTFSPHGDTGAHLIYHTNSQLLQAVCGLRSVMVPHVEKERIINTLISRKCQLRADRVARLVVLLPRQRSDINKAFSSPERHAIDFEKKIGKNENNELFKQKLKK